MTEKYQWLWFLLRDSFFEVSLLSFSDQNSMTENLTDLEAKIFHLFISREVIKPMKQSNNFLFPHDKWLLFPSSLSLKRASLHDASLSLHKQFKVHSQLNVK